MAFPAGHIGHASHAPHATHATGHAVPPMPPGSAGGAVIPPTDYAQQLFSYLGAWRQHLEQALGAAPGTTTPPTGAPVDIDASDWFPADRFTAL